MITVQIQAADILYLILSLLGLMLGIFALGGAVTWLFLWMRRRKAPASDTGDHDSLYMVFSRISHRLKTAGEVIRGHLHGFSDDLPRDSERWRVARRAIADEASGVDSFVNRLDLLIRLGMKEQPLVMEPINIPRLLEDLMVELGPAADDRGIVLGGIVSNSARSIPHISADPIALREVFSNLLENAVKHNEKGTEVTAEVRLQNGQLLVRIADNGKGIPPEILAGIFGRGQRHYHPSTNEGTGMGLYLCKRLVELHDGKITASNAEPHGAEFCITLPLRRSK